MSSSPELVRYQRSRAFAMMTTIYIALLGLVPLTGWLLHVEMLKRIVPGASPVKPNMAVGFLLCAIAFALLSNRTKTLAKRRWATAVAATVVLLGALTLGEHFFGWDLRIEQWLIGNTPSGLSGLHPARMTSASAFVFLLGGTALLAEAFIVRKQVRVPAVLGLSVALVLMGGTPLAAFLVEILLGARWNFMGMDASGVIGAVGFTLMGTGLLILLRSEGEFKWSLSGWTTGGFLVGVLLVVMAAGAGFDFTIHMVETNGRVTHRQELLKETEEVLNAVTSLIRSERIYVIVGDERLLKDRQATKATLDDNVRRLRVLTRADPNQQRRLDELEPLIAQCIGWEERVISARRQESSASAASMIGTGPELELSDKLLGMIKEVKTEEYRLFGDDRKRADVASSTALSLLPMGVFLSLSVLALSAFFLNAGVTQQGQAERALRQSEERYRTLFESNPNPMWVYDVESLSFLAVNNAAVNHYGYSPTEFLAMTIKDIRPAEDIPGLVDNLDQTTTALGSSSYWRHRKKDGTVIDVEISSHELVWLGHRARVVLVKDITERKRAEEQLKEQAAMLDRAHDAIIVRNFDDRRIIFWNSGAERLYGWSAREAIGQPVDELILAKSEELGSIATTLLSTGEFRGELKEITKDKRELIVEVWSTLVLNSDGTPRSVLSIHNDISEQKKLEAQLLRAQRLESIGTLASGVAHDLNNILTPILMCSQALRSELGEEDRQSALALIEESAQRGAGIVKQVLTFARGVEGERVLIKPSHLIQEIVDIARKTFPKSIEIKGRYPDDLWSIEGDPTQLHQVLLNLSVNARDAMPDGGSLAIWAENFVIDEHYASMTPDARAGQYVALRVTDTGTGMPRAVLDKIFDPFYTTKEVGKGTGLGLSTTLGIVKSHRGFISVYSEQGKGTTFKLFLPATVTHQELQHSKTSVVPIQGNGELILVVDDEPNILGVTKMILEKHHYDVVSASDGPEALAIFAQQMQSIRLVLTDVSMPYMDGAALARALKKMKSDVPIIASTGQGEQAGLADFEALGVKNFLAKPYSTQQLLATVRDTLHEKNEQEV
jgi:two-component system cell cycle sensor histidine kinase/response regulator CckA